MPTYTENTRAQRPDTGDLLGVWGDGANETIFDVFDKSFGHSSIEMADANKTFEIPNGTISPPDDPRALALTITSNPSLTQDRTVTLAPNSVSKVWFIRNLTGGGFNIIISQGGGGNVTIAPGFTAVVYTDGAGGPAEVVNLFDKLAVTELVGTLTTAAQANIDHDTLLNSGGDQHVLHASVEIDTAADSGLGGGGDIAATRAIVLDVSNLPSAVLDDNADQFAFRDDSGALTGKATWLELKDAVDWALRITPVVQGGLQVIPVASSPTGVEIRFNGSLPVEPDGSLVENLVVDSDGGNSRVVDIGLVPLSLFLNDINVGPTLIGTASIGISGQGIGGEGTSLDFNGTLSGVLVGDYCIAQPPTNYARDLVYRAYVDATNSLKFIIMNPEDASSNIVGGAYKVMVLRP